MTPSTPDALRQFFSAYYHEDWSLEAKDPDEVVAAFVAERRSREELSSMAEMIDSYARASHDDASLEKALLSDLGCYYLPSADGLSARAWLHHVAHLLRASAGPVA